MIKLIATAWVLLLCGCTTTLRDNFQENISKYPFTREQKAVAEDYGYRLVFAKMLEEGKFEILYSRLPKDMVVRQAKTSVDMLKSILDRQDKDSDKYNETYGLRPYWEHQEKIFKAIYGRATADFLNDVFEEKTGDRPWYSGKRDEFGYDHSKGYDPTVYTVTDLGTKFPFESKLINEAKEAGVLEPIETYVVERSRKYDHKEPDPSAPDDVNRFIWREKKYSLKVTKYKVVVPGEQPKDAFTNYMEVFRVVGGKPESKPCVKAFFNGHATLALAVIDVDHEKDGLGFGLPDFVEPVNESQLVSENLITRLYPDSEDYKRQEVKRPPIRADIAPVGTEIDVWETSKDPNGYRVPYTYQNEDSDNYGVGIKFEKQKADDKGHQKLRQVEYIEKRWRLANGGTVVEFFKPKTPFDQKVRRADALSYGEPRLEFVFEDGSERNGHVTPGANQFIGDKPQAIEYTLGEKRYLIKDFDGNGKYEKRRTVTEDSFGYSYRSRHEESDVNGFEDTPPVEKPRVPQE